MKNRRSLNRKFLKCLPETTRYRLIRTKIPRCETWPEPLVIKLAETEEELSNAFRLLHDSYVKSGFMRPHPSGMRILPQHLLPQTSTIVAKWDGTVIGTLSLIRDNVLGLPMEKLFDLTDLRRKVGRLAEVSSLAVDPSFRGKIDQALFPLFRYITHFGINNFGIDGFAIAVNPSMEDLYRGFLLFGRIEHGVKTYDFVNGAPAVGLYIEFATLRERAQAAFRDRLDHVQWFLGTDIRQTSGNILPPLDYFVTPQSAFTPKLLETYFLGRTQVVRSLSIREFQALRNAYPHRSFQDVFDRALADGVKARKELRFDAKMSALIESHGAEGDILNVSSNGIQLRCECALKTGEVLRLKVQINHETEVKLEAKVRWESPGLYGLEILVAPIEWLRMNNHLAKNLEVLAGAAA